MRDCEVRDFVQAVDGSRQLRLHNQAAVAELVRRGEPVPALPSGELPPDAIWWAVWCQGRDTGQGWLEEPI